SFEMFLLFQVSTLRGLYQDENQASILLKFLFFVRRFDFFYIKLSGVWGLSTKWVLGQSVLTSPARYVHTCFACILLNTPFL
ncbi:MAG: hypothetical protein LUC97_10370, partial [Clostridiales bacterium]|nr:hypothetical protein [Clostridiales bacterium]